jgi:hypothetical protein
VRVFRQCVAEPGAGIRPAAVGGASADAHHLGRLAEGQAGEGAQPHQFGPGGVLASQCLQGLVQGQEVVAGRVDEEGVEIDPDAPALPPRF